MSKRKTLSQLQPESYFLGIQGRPGCYLHPGPDTDEGDKTYLVKNGLVGAAVWTAENAVMFKTVTARQDLELIKVTEALK